MDARESLLSTSRGYNNYRGILNLCVVLLVLSNARAALENIIKYGILVDPVYIIRLFLVDGAIHLPALVIVLLMNLFILSSLLIEKFIASLKKKSTQSGSDVYTIDDNLNKLHANGGSASSASSSPTATSVSNDCSSKTILVNEMKASSVEKQIGLIGLFMIIVNLSALLIVPSVIIFQTTSHPATMIGAIFSTCIIFMKLLSYHSMMFYYRDVKRPAKQQSLATKLFLRSYVSKMSELEAYNKQQNEQQQGLSNGPQTTAKVPLKPRQTSPTTLSIDDDDDDDIIDEAEYREEAIRKLYHNVRVPYPHNLTVKNIYYFMIAPTLCYELEFPRTKRIRKHFLLKRIIEVIILSQLTLALIQQWIVPTVNNSLIPFRQMQYSHMLERLLKLAIPNHVIWLICFYLFFHSYLNIVAELTRFADREFYQDWWNSESVDNFWRSWNIPTHKWCARHLYIPFLAFGFTRYGASIAVFLVSAFFHEYLVSLPLQMFRYWAFFGMLSQMPLARFIRAYFNNQFANVAVWISLLIGQPLCILMYYHDYYVINRITT